MGVNKKEIKKKKGGRRKKGRRERGREEEEEEDRRLRAERVLIFDPILILGPLPLVF